LTWSGPAGPEESSLAWTWPATKRIRTGPGTSMSWPGRELRTSHLPFTPAKAAAREVDALPVGQLARAGVNVGINTDQRTITDTDLSREYTRLGRADGYWTAAMLRQANRWSMAAAFADEGTKARLLAML
jgi:adenosine deaminase